MQKSSQRNIEGKKYLKTFSAAENIFRGAPTGLNISQFSSKAFCLQKMTGFDDEHLASIKRNYSTEETAYKG